MPNREISLTRPLPAADWHDRPLLPIKQAAELLGVSRAQLYKLAHSGRLELQKSLGKTVVPAREVLRLLEAAEPWTPSDRNAPAVAALKARRERTPAAA